MFEKVNPNHPDKVADRIGGAIVDLGYAKRSDAIIAGEILLGHGECSIIIETNVKFTKKEIKKIVNRVVSEKVKLNLKVVPQDEHLAENQSHSWKCGDNGIFKGEVVSKEEKKLTEIADKLYNTYLSDGKYILDGDKLIICQSNAFNEELKKDFPKATINPLGEWTGGINVDTGCVNRKLGSDMGKSVTGGGLHFKDLSKADVSLNIYAWLKAQITKKKVEISCAIGDDLVDGKSYDDIVALAQLYITEIGGFEKFAEWGLIRPEDKDVNLNKFSKYFLDK